MIIRPQLIVISAPSGCGKTTIVQHLLRRHPELEFSVSATTRPQRPREVDGRDYFFLSREDFLQKVSQGELVEWEEIYGYYYGTLKREVDRALTTEKRMLFDVDVKGALSIKKHYPDDTLLVFIKPPSLDALKERLRKRNTEDDAALQRRLERVPMELEQERYFDHAVVNDDVERAVADVERLAGLNAVSKEQVEK